CLIVTGNRDNFRFWDAHIGGFHAIRACHFLGIAVGHFAVRAIRISTVGARPLHHGKPGADKLLHIGWHTQSLLIVCSVSTATVKRTVANPPSSARSATSPLSCVMRISSIMPA